MGVVAIIKKTTELKIAQIVLFHTIKGAMKLLCQK
jgi:hypothetical protein